MNSLNLSWPTKWEMRLFSLCLCSSYRLQDSPSQVLPGPGHCPGRKDPTPEVHISVMVSLDLDQSHSNCWSRPFRPPVCVVAKSLQSYPTLCNTMDCSMPGSSVHGILQARILEWVAIPFCRVSSWPRDQTQVSCSAGGFFTIWATRETLRGTGWFLISNGEGPSKTLILHQWLLHLLLAENQKKEGKVAIHLNNSIPE